MGDTESMSASLLLNVPAESLPNSFSTFFAKKVMDIRCGLKLDTDQLVHEEKSPIHTPLVAFSPATPDEIMDIIVKSPNKSCELDPIPTWLLKECLSELLPQIVAIVNQSMIQSHVPPDFKFALVRPRLKKLSLDHDVLKNYRPVSNLRTYLKFWKRL